MEVLSPHSMLAAVDMGSNSFRMVIARVVDDQVLPVDRLREGVRLASYLDSRQMLTPEGFQRALDCLHIFGQRLGHFSHGAVRAVGTNTLRKARNSELFLSQAQEALGHPIEIISGLEEARLIFLGAAHSLAGGPDRRLVVDIGGGSTEAIIGDGFDPVVAESLYMGCVGMTLAHFPDGQLSAQAMERAETAARLELRSIKKEYCRLGWTEAVGASGTVHAIGAILRENGWSERGITFEGLRQLRQTVLEFGSTSELNVLGLRRDRARVLPGGLAILNAIFDSLEVESMRISTGALREGVLYDLLGRLRHEDARDLSIQRFVDQYRVDTQQAKRVERTALQFLDSTAESWKLDLEDSRAFLSWAASLHEIGLGVAHGGHHKHGAYLVQHSDMPGFSYQDQRLLSLLIRGHRRKLPKSLFFEMLPKDGARRALRLCLLLRLSCLLNRSRSPRSLPQLSLTAKGKSMEVIFPAGWLEAHPLTQADFEQERVFWKSAGLKLSVVDSGS